MDTSLNEVIKELFSKADDRLDIDNNDVDMKKEEFVKLVNSGTQSLINALQTFLELHAKLSINTFTNLRYAIGVNFFANNILNVLLTMHEEYRENEIITNILMAALALKDGLKEVKEFNQKENITLN